MQFFIGCKKIRDVIKQDLILEICTVNCCCSFTVVVVAVVIVKIFLLNYSVFCIQVNFRNGKLLKETEIAIIIKEVKKNNSVSIAYRILMDLNRFLLSELIFEL